MKSSLNPQRADASNDPVWSKWMPLEFSAEAPQDNAAHAAGLLTLFSPEHPHRMAAGGNGASEASRPGSLTPGNNIYKSGLGTVLQAWDPGDLLHIPPFVQEKQSYQSSFTSPHVTTSSARRYMDPIQRAEAETLDNARQRAEEMIAQANKEAGDLRLAAHDEMMAVRAAAHEEGLAQAKQEMKSALEACATIIDQVQDWKKSLFAQSEPLILGIVHEIAQVIFGEGVVLDDQALQENLSRIVENASSIGDLKIFLNPHDAAMLNPAWREHETIVLGSKVQVIPADAISCGGAYVQGQMGTVDARVETQLRSVLESLAELKLQNEAGT